MKGSPRPDQVTGTRQRARRDVPRQLLDDIAAAGALPVTQEVDRSRRRPQDHDIAQGQAARPRGGEPSHHRVAAAFAVAARQRLRDDFEGLTLGRQHQDRRLRAGHRDGLRTGGL